MARTIEIDGHQVVVHEDASPEELDQIAANFSGDDTAPILDISKLTPSMQQEALVRAGVNNETAPEDTAKSPPAEQPAPQSPSSSEDKGFLSNWWDAEKQGFRDAQDFVGPINPLDSRSSDEIYPKMEELEPVRNLKAKIDKGEKYNRQDLEQAFLAVAGNNPAGKALGALNVLPQASLISSLFSHKVIPKLAKMTGANPEDFQVALMGLGAITGTTAAAKELTGKPLFNIRDEAGNLSSKGLPAEKGGLDPIKLPVTEAIVKGTTYPIRHPLKSIGAGINIGTKLILPIVKPVARSILEGDNPITGEPGLKTALKSDVAKRGEEIGKNLDVNFSAGELTGHPSTLSLEDTLANSGKYGGRFAEAHKQKTDTIINNFKTTLDKIYPEAVSKLDAGDKLATAYNKSINDIVTSRRTQANKDFGEALAAEDGNPYIRTDNLFKVAKELKKEGESRLLTPAKAAGAKEANTLLKKLSESTPEEVGADYSKYTGYAEPGTVVTKAAEQKALPITLEEMANGLSDFYTMSRKSGGILDDVKTAAQRRVYTRLYGALLQDLDTEINSPQTTPNRAAALNTARSNYADASNKIADLEKTTLGKMIGSAAFDSEGNLSIVPEKVADKFISMKPSEVLNTLKFLDNNHPEVAQLSRRYTLERALDMAQQGKGMRGVGTSKNFAKTEFVKNLPDPDTLKAIFKNDSNAAQQVLDVAEAMNRLSDWGAIKKGSATAERSNIMKMLEFSKGALVKSLTSESLVEDLLNPQLRKSMAKEANTINKKTNPKE